MKESVTSGNDFQVTQAVFFPLPAKADSYSVTASNNYSVKDWKSQQGQIHDFLKGGLLMKREGGGC